MRKLIVFSMISLDGVMQAPGGPKEDTSGGFKYGGWVAPYSDEAYNNAVRDELKVSADYLLGRKTYEIWAAYWPEHKEMWPGINDNPKYVFSKNLKKSDSIVKGWKHSVVIRSVGEIKKLKKRNTAKHGAINSEIHVWGSSKLVQLLLKNDLVDELRLKIHPLTLGKGKKLFGKGTIPAAFKLLKNEMTPKGVFIATYVRAGKVRTGNAGD